MNRGKKYVEAAKAIDRATLYDTDLKQRFSEKSSSCKI